MNQLSKTKNQNDNLKSKIDLVPKSDSENLNFDIYTLNYTLYLPRLIDKDRLTEKEGLLGAIYNSAWVIGPLIGGVIAAKYGIGTTFLAAAGVSILAFLVLPIFGMPRASVDEAISNPLAGIKHGASKPISTPSAWSLSTAVGF